MQVRDLLHVDDLVNLVEDQLARPDRWSGVTANVGGGRGCSLSLIEATEICRDLTGNDLPMGSIANNRPGDVPLYVSDCERLSQHTDWRPRRGSRQIMEDIFTWINENETAVIATAGGIVSNPETYGLLLRRTHAVWISAQPEEHMSRVMKQGDFRPMARNREAMADLHAILEARRVDYARAEATLDTSGASIQQSFAKLVKLVAPWTKG